MAQGEISRLEDFPLFSWYLQHISVSVTAMPQPRSVRHRAVGGFWGTTSRYSPDDYLLLL